MTKEEKEIPCDTCVFMEECAKQELECSAARNWYGSGTYLEEQIGKHRRSFAKK